MKHSESEWLHVAVAVVRNPKNQILIAKRPDYLHQGGLWEFPGGKVEKGENIQQALVRELNEEVGINVFPERPLIEIRHDYGDKKVLLDVWLCHLDAEQAQQSARSQRGKEGQLVRWLPRDALTAYAFPEANKVILQALSLPSSYLITPEVGDAQLFLESIDIALDQGIKLIQFRDKTLSEAEYIQLAGIIGEKCKAASARLLIKGGGRLQAVELAAGVHLTSAELKQYRTGDFGRLREEMLLAVSCHNLEEIRLAEQIGADFVTLSPVLVTTSHPEAAVLGWEKFQHCCKQATIPVYALGGLQGEHMQTAWLSGAQGIAAIRGLWSGSFSGS